jgi:hypothetical protein
MALRQRYQNPTINDTVRLKLFSFNSNLPQSFYAIDKVDIFYKDPTLVSDTNPDGRRLVETVESSAVVNDAPGSYYVDLSVPGDKYVIGEYIDSWDAIFEENDDPVPVENIFQIFPRLWYTTAIPVVYDFQMSFQPNRIVQGSKKWIIIEIIPNVPKVTELERYYTNLAITADMTISIAKKCDPCLPQEQDLRIIVEDAPVEQREKVFGYYWLDTSDMDGGLYDVWFTLNIGGNVYVSERNQLLIMC